MKKLIRLIPIVVTGVVILAAAGIAHAQGRDFGGSWTLDVEKSGTKDGPSQAIITQTEKELTVKFGPTAPAMSFNLDGTERVVKEQSATTRAVWKGDKLEVTVKMPPPPAAGDHPAGDGPESITISRDGGWLVLEAKGKDHRPMKLFFKKAPAK